MFRGPNRLISLDLSFEARFPKCSGKQKEMAAQALKKSGRGPLVPRHLRLAGPVFTDGDQRAQLYPRNQTYHTSYWQVPTICGSLYRPSYHRCRHMCWASNGGRSHASSSYSSVSELSYSNRSQQFFCVQYPIRNDKHALGTSREPYARLPCVQVTYITRGYMRHGPP